MNEFEFIAFDENGTELSFELYHRESYGKYGTLTCAKKMLHCYNVSECGNGYVACVGEYRETEDY